MSTSKLQLARAYVTAYAAWWRSLVTPPYNAHKSTEHKALVVAQREAWVAWGDSIQAARMMIGDNYAR